MTAADDAKLVERLRAAGCTSDFDSECEYHFREAADCIERLTVRLQVMGKAGDVLAHQLYFKRDGAVLDSWWNSRGGQAACTVCNDADPWLDAPDTQADAVTASSDAHPECTAMPKAEG